MPPFMPRPSPSWIVIVVSLGGMLPAARAADPPCPTQVVPAGAPPAAAGAAPEAKPLRGEGNISLDSDQATLGADNSMTLEGNVVVRQGEREIRDRKSTRLNSSHSQISYAVFCLKKKNNDKSHSTFSDTVFILVSRRTGPVDSGRSI